MADVVDSKSTSSDLVNGTINLVTVPGEPKQQTTETTSNIDVDLLKAELEKYKAATTKANSEAAEYKKQLRAKLTEEEQQKIAADENLKAIQAELEGLRKEKTLTAFKASYLSLGYDEALAEETAKHMIDGEHDKVFANHKKFLEAKEKAIKAEVLNQQPPLTSGMPLNVKDKGDEALRRAMGLK